MDDIVREFLIECNELLDQMDSALIGLEKDPDSRELLNKVFRAVHTIKGTSGTLGYPCLERVSHSAENLLSLLRRGQAELSPEMATALLSVIDVLRRVLADVEVAGKEGNHDTGPITSLLESFVSRGSVQGMTAVVDGAAVLESGPRVSSSAVAAAECGTPVSDHAIGGKSANLNVATSTIRVDVHLLDKLMDLVGELVLARNQLLQTAARINDTPLARTAVRLKALTSELQEGITKTRMQPIENVWKKLPRLVRDVSAACEKSVRLEMQGAETELDKTLLEAINDPLMHIIRNSIDHGIEAADERAERGKPPEGHILLRAFHEGGQVNIEVSDDGRGIFVERVKQKAVQDGAITAAQATVMSVQEGMNLIFLPGISTAHQVTSVSGRGVGMDVVKTNIEKIGGTIDLVSEEGVGTKLTIKIPLTLAIISALIVSSHEERFAIPQASLVELVRLEDDSAQRQIERIHGQPVYRLRGNLLPLIELNRELNFECCGENRSCSIVVLRSDGHQFGLVVDEIFDTEEIVVKPLASQIKMIHCFSGATILGDGHVALILDVSGIAKQAGFAEEDRRRAMSEVARHGSTKGDSWLLFRIGATGRVALQLSAVSRLEKVNVTSVERSGDFEVMQYRGEIVPLFNVARFLGRESEPVETEFLEVVVHPHAGHNVGLVVDEIIDIVQGHSLLEERHSQPGIAGCAVIQGRVTDLLDVRAALASMNYHDEKGAGIAEEVCA